MDSFDVSWAVIFKIILAGAFSYIILPVLLVVRDLFLHEAINKFILTDKFNLLIMMCENDRWFLNNKYNKSIHISYGSKGEIYKLDDNVVSGEQFYEHEKK